VACIDHNSWSFCATKLQYKLLRPLLSALAIQMLFAHPCPRAPGCRINFLHKEVKDFLFFILQFSFDFCVLVSCFGKNYHIYKQVLDASVMQNFLTYLYAVLAIITSFFSLHACVLSCRCQTVLDVFSSLHLNLTYCLRRYNSLNRQKPKC
jgi:hypothetical protein